MKQKINLERQFLAMAALQWYAMHDVLCDLNFYPGKTEYVLRVYEPVGVLHRTSDLLVGPFVSLEKQVLNTGYICYRYSIPCALY